MKLVLLASGRLRETYAKLAAEEFVKRIRALAPFEVTEVAEAKGASPGETGKRLLARVKPGDRVVLLTESREGAKGAGGAPRSGDAPRSGGGREMTSEEFARWIGKAHAAGRGRLVFVVGGPYGVGDDLAERADEKLALGRMTLPHELARVVLLEQIYRALTILQGRAYHHG